MRNVTILGEISAITKENKDNQDTINEINKSLPPYEWMLNIARKYGFDKEPILISMENHKLEIDLVNRLKEEININKVEIKYLWKRMKSISGQR